jgi:probable phosphoglycerate mutase
MTAVYLLRHPETTWNVAQRYQGRLDSMVTGEGKQQAKVVARAFAGSPLDAVYSSPLSRALCLADELVRVTGAPLRTDYRLTEIGQGVWEGLFLHEIRSCYPDLFEQWYVRPDTVVFPGGEGLRDVAQRGLSSLADIFARYPEGNVAVVTHSVVIMALVASALGMHLRQIHRIRVANAGITTLCGTEIPGALLALNVTEPLYGSPVASARAQDCVSWKRRRVAS